MSSQRGQALVETAVAIVVLAAVIGAIPCLTAYHDVQRATLRSARDAAYMSGWKGLSDSATLTRRAASALAQLPWTHPADGTRLVPALSQSDVEHADSPPPGRAAGLMDFIAQPLAESQGLLGASLELNRAGFHSLEVSVEVPAIRGAPAPFSQFALRLAERAAVLTESWNAGSSHDVVARVKPLVPSARLERLVEPMQVLIAPLSLLEPAIERLCVGLIEPDRVPETRLGDRAARSRATVNVSGACR